MKSYSSLNIFLKFNCTFFVIVHIDSGTTQDSEQKACRWFFYGEMSSWPTFGSVKQHSDRTYLRPSCWFDQRRILSPKRQPSPYPLVTIIHSIAKTNLESYDNVFFFISYQLTLPLLYYPTKSYYTPWFLLHVIYSPYSYLFLSWLATSRSPTTYLQRR